MPDISVISTAYTPGEQRLLIKSFSIGKDCVDFADLKGRLLKKEWVVVGELSVTYEAAYRRITVIALLQYVGG